MYHCPICNKNYSSIISVSGILFHETTYSHLIRINEAHRIITGLDSLSDFIHPETFDLERARQIYEEHEDIS